MIGHRPFIDGRINGCRWEPPKNDFGQKTEICKGNSAERVAAVSGSSDNRRAPSLDRIQVQLMDTIDGAGDSFPPNAIVQWRPPWAEAFSYFGGSSASQGGCCCWSIISDSQNKVCEPKGRWLGCQTGTAPVNSNRGGV